MGKQKFNVGDVVCLLSGGPNMTVESYSVTFATRVTVVWFDKESLCQRQVFEQDVLVLTEVE